MLKIEYHNQFKKDYKLAKKRGANLSELQYVVSKLANREPLEAKYRDHSLTGNYKDCRECHIQPDWLLIYRIDGERLILTLIRTGSHSDLF